MILLHVDGMNCGHCVKTITNAVRQLDRNASIDIDIPAKTVRIVTVNAEAGAIVEVIAKAGYRVLEEMH